MGATASTDPDSMGLADAPARLFSSDSIQKLFARTVKTETGYSGSFNGVKAGLSLDHFSEVLDRAAECFLKLDLRLPFQERARPADIGLPDFWIIGWERMMGDVAR